MIKILSIDDEKIFHNMIIHALKGGDYQVETALNGNEGIQKARAFKPDLIITDLNMPGMSGWDVLATLKAGTDTVALPVIALSGNASDEDRQKGAAAGFSGFVGKPLDMA